MWTCHDESSLHAINLAKGLYCNISFQCNYVHPLLINFSLTPFPLTLFFLQALKDNFKMAAYAALVSLLNNIHAVTKHPQLSTSFDNIHIQSLVEKTNILLEFIEGNTYGGGSKEVQDLERQIASAAHTAEDVIESHIVDQIHAGTSESSPACSLDLQKTIQDMEAVMEKITEFKEKREVTDEKSRHQSVAAGPLKEDGESGMVGLDAELIQLLDELTGYQSSRRIISIVGMGGSGKTTLTKSVYGNELVKEHFQFRSWATISEQHNPQKVLSNLLSIEEKISSRTIDDLGEQLYKTLFGRKYLIIIDDIWSVTAWDEVKRFFPDNNNGSRILLTTRLTNVAKDCGSSLFMMNLLDEANSWKLFCEKAFPYEDCPPELREVGEEIVKLCKGLALSIVVIGGLLLKSPRSVEHWKSVAKDLKSTLNSKEKQESLDVLSLSYHHLPAHLKPFFLYMGIFKEDLKIRVTEIVNLWVAEGFIKPIGSRVLEDIAEGYIKDLIHRNLILVVRHRKNGKFGSCGIHDLLRDLCIKLAEQEKLFDLTQDGVRGTGRRVIDDRDVGRTEVNLPLTRSYFKGGGWMEPPAHCRLLRVADALFNSSTYCANVNLRHVVSTGLYARRNTVWKLPPSVNRSGNLQTLIIKNRMYPPVIFPPDFWNLRQLRHVECSTMYILDPPRSNQQDAMWMLENLRTLKTVVNLRLSEEVCKFIPNIKKLSLFYTSKEHGYDDSLIKHLFYLDRLHKLESLYLDMWGFRSVSPNRELEKKLTASFPRSLKKLSLEDFKLEWDDMTMIGSLPQLEVLQLNSLIVSEGGQWSPFDEQFLRLKFLSIRHCDLVSWDAEASHFPVLEKLHLEGMECLEEIPLGIGDIPTLQLISVDYCSESVAISAVRIKEDQLDNGGQLQVQLNMSHAEVEAFKQKLETEGLTMSNIIWK